MTSCSLGVKFPLCCKWWNHYLEYTINQLPIETKLFIILFKLVQLTKFMLTLTPLCILKISNQLRSIKKYFLKKWTQSVNLYLPAFNFQTSDQSNFNQTLCSPDYSDGNWYFYLQEILLYLVSRISPRCNDTILSFRLLLSYKKRYVQIISDCFERYTDVYRSPTKLLEGNVFTRVYLPVHPGGGAVFVQGPGPAFRDTFKLHRLGNNCRGTSLSRFGIRLKFLHVFQ